MRGKKLCVLFLIFILLVSMTACGQTKPTAEPAKQPVAVAPEKQPDALKDTVFVSAAWLKDNLKNVVVIDVRKDSEYAGGHIPGAVNAIWQYFSDIKGKPGDANWGILLSQDQLTAKIGALGINNEKSVVIYGQPPAWGEEGRVLWTLKTAGIKNAKILEGGISAWKALQGEIIKDAVTPMAAKYETASLDTSLNATTDWIVANQKKIKIIDVRSPKEYAGATDFGEARGGHLPGAVNIPFEGLFNKDGAVKSSAEIKQMFTGACLTPDDEIVLYCTKGIRSGYMALMMRMVGFSKAKNYDASYYEWAGNKSLPIEK